MNPPLHELKIGRLNSTRFLKVPNSIWFQIVCQQRETAYTDSARQLHSGRVLSYDIHTDRKLYCQANLLMHYEIFKQQSLSERVSLVGE